MIKFLPPESNCASEKIYFPKSITGARDKSTLGINPLDLLNGQIIENKDIAEVDFLPANSVLKFT